MIGFYKNVNTLIMVRFCIKGNDMGVNLVMIGKLIILVLFKSDYLVLKFVYFLYVLIVFFLVILIYKNLL